MAKQGIIPEPAEKYVAPRDDPLKYPGKRPERSFILADRKVYPILYNNKETGAPESTYAGNVVTDEEGDISRIDDYLKSRGKPPLGERYAVLGFGSNPVPGQLLSKFGEDAVVPVIFGILDDADIVYNLISNYGYAFAELALEQKDVRVNVAVTFLDSDQLGVMNETEKKYGLAFVPRNIALESGEEIRGGENDVPALFYAGERKIWVPEGYCKPIAVKEIPSLGRTAEALNEEEVLDLIVEQFGLAGRGIHSGRELAYHLREEASEDGPNKVKDYLQSAVADSPRSLEPVSSLVTLLENPETPPKMFGDK